MQNGELLPFAAIHYPKGFHIDQLLSETCSYLSKTGLRLGGLLQISTGGVGGCATSVHTVDLRTGEEFDIWEKRGACAKGCRLDERGLVLASAVIEKAIEDGVDLIIVNRFGRAESLRRGLLDCFINALEAQIPVLTAVREPYDGAWAQFHGGLAVDLVNDHALICDWAQRSTSLPLDVAPAEQFVQRRGHEML